MRVKEINEEMILFDNGMKITYDHKQDCCEYNYADFEQLEHQIDDIEFDEESMKFEKVDDFGFRFGSKRTHMYFVPCYSEQNGYYSSEIQIYFNGEEVLSLYCEEILD